MLTANIRQTPVNIYLTSDDGPGPGSCALYAFAENEKVKFTIFVVGNRLHKNDSADLCFHLHRCDSLLLFANHSYSHANKHYRSAYDQPQNMFRDFEQNRDSLSFDNRIARLPGRNCWRLNGKRIEDLDDARPSADSLATHGYLLFGWDLEWKYDSSHRIDAHTFLEKIDKWTRLNWTFTPENFVILFHDAQFKDPAFRTELHLFLQLIRNRPGWHLQHLTAYRIPPPDSSPH